MNDVYNLERATALKERIDPTGKKWEIKGNRGSSLVHARPNPDRADAQIPKEFIGKWTSPSTLAEKIDAWLNKQWDLAEALIAKAERKAQAAKENPVVAPEPKTAEESLAELPEEIKQELGDMIATKPDVETLPWAELQSMAKDMGVTGRSRKDLVAGIQAAG